MMNMIQNYSKLNLPFFHLFGYTAIGAVAGFTIGLTIPFLGFVEAGVGAVIGTIAGLGLLIYDLCFNWDDRMEKINKIGLDLKRIHDDLIVVEEQLQMTYKVLETAELGLEEKIKEDSCLEIQRLQQYIEGAYDNFMKLEKILLHTKLCGKSD